MRIFLLLLAATITITSSAIAQTATWRGHTGSGVSAVAVSKDGKLIASAGLDRTVRVWDAATGKLARAFVGHKNEVYSVDISPDGKEIASSDYDGSVLVWNGATGKVRLTLKIDGWSTAVVFSPDGTKLGVANQRRGSTIFDAKTGKEWKKLETSGNSNTAVFSPDGRYFVAASIGPGFWNLESGKFERGFRGHTDSVKAMAFSPDGKWIASAGSDKTARIWNVEKGEVYKTFETATTIIGKDYPKPFEWKMPVVSVAFSPDGKTLAMATGRAIHLWNIESGANFKTLNGHELTVTSVAFLPDGKRIVSGSIDNTVRIWDVAVN